MAWSAVAVAILLWSVPAAAIEVDGDERVAAAVASEIRSILGQTSAVGLDTSVAAEGLRRLYSSFAYAPVWHLDGERRERGRIVEDALRAAEEHGFDTADLHLDALSPSTPTPRSIAERDILLSDVFIRYAVKLRDGSVPAFGANDFREGRGDRFDPADALIHALWTGTIARLLVSLPPPDLEYRQLVDALRRHRRIVGEGGWPVVPGTTELKLGGADPRLPALRGRLLAEGDLDAEGSAESPEALSAAVRRFQLRHGLEPDGRIGQLTLRELAITTDQRSRQIAVNLERWRWLPRQRGDTYITVNVAAATLILTRGGVPGRPKRVIVGDEKHPTPALAARLIAITLNPPWNVPASIATREILPKLKRNPRYLADNDIVILGWPGDPFGFTVDWPTISARNFPFRLQQRPGPKNALGAIKFEIPNRFDVYLHDTPSKRLFARSRRALSHGCVRVERPIDLAAALLDDVAWSAEAFERAVAAGESRRIAIARPVPVYLAYFTAFVDEGGRLNFLHDLYGRDARIERALGRAQRPGSKDNPDGLPGGCPEPTRPGQPATSH